MKLNYFDTLNFLDEYKIPDSHIHIEGLKHQVADHILCEVPDDINKDRRQVFQYLMNGKSYSEIINSKLNKVDKFNFSQFLHLLGKAKACLFYSKQTAYAFIYKGIHDIVKTSPLGADIGFTPSIGFERALTSLQIKKLMMISGEIKGDKFVIPTYSIRLSKEQQKDIAEFDESILSAIDDAINSVKYILRGPICIVIEIKRQHINFNDPRLKHISKFINKLSCLNIEKNLGLNIAVSVCGMADRFPLSQERLKTLINFLNNLEYQGLELRMHLAEQPFPSTNKHPSIELDNVLKGLGSYKERRIGKIQLIHLGQIFGRTSYFDRKTQLWKSDPINYIDKDYRYCTQEGIEKLIGVNQEAGILVCPESNKHLAIPNILEFSKVVEAIAHGKINVILGTDDPGIFKLENISDQYAKLEETWIKKIKNKKVRSCALLNTRKSSFDKNLDSSETSLIDYSRRYGLDSQAMTKYYGYDIDTKQQNHKNSFIQPQIIDIIEQRENYIKQKKWSLL